MIKKQNVIGMMLATTVALGALAGCNSPAQTGMPSGSGGQMAAPKQAAGAQTSQATAQAMAEERESENYGYMADDAEMQSARYAVMMVGQPAPKQGEVAITADLNAEAGAGAKGGGTASGGGQSGASGSGSAGGSASGGGAKAEGKGGLRIDFKGKLKADLKAKLEERKAKLKAKAKVQLDKMKDEKQAVDKAAKAAKWVDNGDGTESKTFEVNVTKTVNGQASTRMVKMVRTRKIEDKTLIAAHYEASTSHNGITRSVVRDKALQEDGSYKVTFHSEMTFKDGSKRVADWSKTISADGAVSGTGTIVWTGKTAKTITVTFGGTEEAETAKCTDTAAGTTSNVTTTAEGTANATTTDTATGATTTVAVDANVDAAVTTETTTTTTASPAPAASASPEASPAPTQGIAVGEPNPSAPSAAGTVETGTQVEGDASAK